MRAEREQPAPDAAMETGVLARLGVTLGPIGELAGYAATALPQSIPAVIKSLIAHPLLATVLTSSSAPPQGWVYTGFWTGGRLELKVRPLSARTLRPRRRERGASRPYASGPRGSQQTAPTPNDPARFMSVGQDHHLRRCTTTTERSLRVGRPMRARDQTGRTRWKAPSLNRHTRLRREDGRRRGRVAERHPRQLLNGQLLEERESLMVRAWVDVGRYDDARRVGPLFHRRLPNGIFGEGVDEACGRSPDLRWPTLTRMM